MPKSVTLNDLERRNTVTADPRYLHVSRASHNHLVLPVASLGGRGKRIAPGDPNPSDATVCYNSCTASDVHPILCSIRHVSNTRRTSCFPAPSSSVGGVQLRRQTDTSIFSVCARTSHRCCETSIGSGLRSLMARRDHDPALRLSTIGDSTSRLEDGIVCRSTSPQLQRCFSERLKIYLLFPIISFLTVFVYSSGF